jgi:hypothetical protein
MSPSLTLIACGLTFLFLAAALGVRADGGQIVDGATGTKFDEIIEVAGQRYKCLGAGVRKLMVAKVYALAFCVEAAHADALVKSYLEAHHAGLRGEPLFDALRKDPQFFDMLAGTKHNRLVVLKMQRDLSRKQLASNIRRSLSPLLPDEKLDKLDAAITTGAKKGEEVTRKLFFVWLGTKSVSPTLREDIVRRAAQLP